MRSQANSTSMWGFVAGVLRRRARDLCPTRHGLMRLCNGLCSRGGRQAHCGEAPLAKGWGFEAWSDVKQWRAQQRRSREHGGPLWGLGLLEAMRCNRSGAGVSAASLDSAARQNRGSSGLALLWYRLGTGWVGDQA